MFLGKLLQNVDPRVRREVAAWVVVVSVIGWPLSAMTWAKDEPAFILALSWLAITFTALDILVSTDVRVEVEENGKE